MEAVARAAGGAAAEPDRAGGIKAAALFALGLAGTWAVLGLTLAVPSVARGAITLAGGMLLSAAARQPRSRLSAAMLGAMILLTAAGELFTESLYFGRPRPGHSDGLLLGALVALPLLPFPMLVHHFAARVGRARPGTLCDRADRRAVWTVTSAVVAVAATAARLLGERCPTTTDSLVRCAPEVAAVDRLQSLVLPALVLVAAVVAARALVLDLVDLGRCLTACAEPGPGEERFTEAGRAHEATTADFVDLGVGEQRWVWSFPADDPYRGGQRALVALAGDPRMAHDLLVEAVRRDLVLLVLAMAGTVLSVAGG